MFYLLSHGGTSKCNGQVVIGIGNDKASQIWYNAISDYMTASTDYYAARIAALDAATALYENGSTEYNTVNAAYAAVNVVPSAFTYVWRAPNGRTLTQDGWVVLNNNAPTSESFVNDPTFGETLQVVGGDLASIDARLAILPVTVEFRVGTRFAKTNKASAQVGLLWWENSVNGVTYLMPSVLTLLSAVPNEPSFSGPFDSSSALHTYRMIIDTGNRVSLYLDGNDAPVSSVDGTTGLNLDYVRVASRNGTSFVEHVAWKENAALTFSQLPSPP